MFWSLAAFFTDYFGLLYLFQIWESSPTPIGFSASVLRSLHRGGNPAKPWTCIWSQIQCFFRTFRLGPCCFFDFFGCRFKQSKPRKACMEKRVTRAEKWPEQKTTIMPQSCQLSHSENLQSLPMSYHFGYAKAYAMLTRVEFFLTRSKLRKPLREVLTRPYASEGFAYAKRVMTRPLLKM